MTMAHARSAYRQTEAHAAIHPVKLIHMMYERTLLHLELAEKGIVENSPMMRGENLGKAIAIVTELSASIKEGDDSEAARFLRGLYQAILLELPKVSLSKDGTTLRKAHSYIARLKQIWEQTAMRENGFSVESEDASAGRPGRPQQEESRSLNGPERVPGISVSI